MNIGRVVACRQVDESEGAVHALCEDGKPACGPWWEGRDPNTDWFEVSEKIGCRICLRVLGDMPDRPKVVLATPSGRSGKILTIHLAATAGPPAPACGKRCVANPSYRRVANRTLVTCSRCLGVDMPAGRPAER